MTTLVLLAWLTYWCLRLWFTCVDVHAESMKRVHRGP